MKRYILLLWLLCPAFAMSQPMIEFDTARWLGDIGYGGKLKPVIEKVNDSIFLFITYADFEGTLVGANGLILVKNNSVVFYDAGFDSAQMDQVIEWTKKHIKLPIRACIITHGHNDRYGGMAALKKHDIWGIASSETYRLMKEKKVELNGAILDDYYDPKWRDKEYWWGHMFYPGPGHSNDNVVIYEPGSSLLYGGCFIKSTDSEDLGNIADANVYAWQHSLRKVREKFPNVKIVIPGHFGWRDAKGIDHTEKLINDFLNLKR